MAVAAATGAGYLLAGKSDSKAAATTLTTRQDAYGSPPGSDNVPETGSRADNTEPVGQAEGRAARQIEAVIEFSLAGRSAVRRGDYSGAVANRRRVLRRLDAIHGATGRVAAAKATLRKAMKASLASDMAYASGRDASVYDTRATALKRSFVREFRPVARQHELTVYGDGDF